MWKRKHKNIPRNAPTKLWFKKSFDFVVPYSLEDWCSYVETLDEGVFNSYGVYMTSLDQRQTAFNISKRAGVSGTVWATGYAEAVDPQSTHVVVGIAGVVTTDIILTILVLGMIWVIAILDMRFAPGLSAIGIATFVVAVFAAVVWISVTSTRGHLIDKLRHK